MRFYNHGDINIDECNFYFELNIFAHCHIVKKKKDSFDDKIFRMYLIFQSQSQYLNEITTDCI